MRSFSRKLNVLKFLYFLPSLVPEQFYFKVIHHQSNFSILIGERSNKTPFQNMETFLSTIGTLSTVQNYLQVITCHHYKYKLGVFVRRILLSPSFRLNYLFIKRNTGLHFLRSEKITLSSRNQELRLCVSQCMAYRGAVIWYYLDESLYKIQT